MAKSVLSKKRLLEKYKRPFALTGNKEKLWLCWREKVLFEKISDAVVVERCLCGAPAYQPSEVGIMNGKL
ncbi:MAG: hypothetical protein AABY15_03920 [Nanoarchaeota archaeon]